MRDMIIGTAGHIDHGKTTLLKALTGIDADRLQEEKRRGITIDIGFAHAEWEDCRLGFIDVPGHERFVKNMLTGIGGIHLVLLVVAADESVMPQTAEHFQICRLLGIPQGVIVLTKKNSVDPELREVVEEEVRELVAGSFLAQAPIVAVDSPSGEGIEELKKAILEQVRRRCGQAPAEDRLFRLPVDRVFSIRGFGTVVTGTPYAGRIRVEQQVQVYPGLATGKIRGIEIFNRRAEEASAGQRSALNLSGLEKQDLVRGMVLASPGSFHPSPLVDARIQLLPDAPAPLRHRSPVRFHHGSAELLGRVHIMEGQEVRPGQSALVQLRLDSPTVGCLGDPFILRRYSPMRTIGGGVILDPSPGKHLKRRMALLAPRLGRLEGTASEILPKGLRFYVDEAGRAGIGIETLASKTGLVPPQVLGLLREMDGIVLVSSEPAWVVGEDQLKAQEGVVVAFLGSYHDRNPLASGVSSEELRRRFFTQEAPGYFQFVMETLTSQQLARVRGGKVGLVEREVRLDDRQSRIQADLLATIEAAEWNPPSLTDLCQELSYPEKEIRDIYFYLMERGELTRLTEGLVLASGRVESFVRRLQERFPKGTAFSVSDFKELFGVTRKYAIPYLEYLDRNGITQRIGDQRVLR